jgi:hypothetical protein
MPKKKKFTTVEILTKARDLLSKEGAWCQGYFAKTKKGKLIESRSKRAASFCMLGAIQRFDNQCQFGLWNPEWYQAKKYVASAIRTSIDNIASWNDKPKRTQEQVIKAFDKAISKAEKDSQKS